MAKEKKGLFCVLHVEYPWLMEACENTIGMETNLRCVDPESGSVDEIVVDLDICSLYIR